jgi:hypothetical protein
MSAGENSEIETLPTLDRAYADDLKDDPFPGVEGYAYNSSSIAGVESSV